MCMCMSGNVILARKIDVYLNSDHGVYIVNICKYLDIVDMVKYANVVFINEVNGIISSIHTCRCVISLMGSGLGVSAELICFCKVSDRI